MGRLGSFVLAAMLAATWQSASAQEISAEVRQMLSAAERLPAEGKPAAALAAAERAKALKDDVGLAFSLLRAGAWFRDLSEFAKALDQYVPAADQFHRIKDSGHEVIALDGCATMCEALAQYRRGADFGERALKVSRDAKDARGEADSLNILGTLYGDLKDGDRALEAFRAALKIRKQARDRAGQAESLNNLGALLCDLRQYREGMDVLRQAGNVCRQANDRPRLATVLNEIGLAYREQGENRKALDAYLEALPVCVEVGDEDAQATALTSIGLVESDLGDKEEAIQRYGKALALRRKLKDPIGEGGVLLNEGIAWSDLGHSAKALALFEQGRAILHREGNVDGEANALIDLGLQMSLLGQLEKARDFYVQALDLCKSDGDLRSKGKALNAVGCAWLESGDLDKAREDFQLALQAVQTASDRAGEAFVLGNIGVLEGRLGKSQEAVVSLRRALDVFRTLGGRGGEATTLASLGLAEEDGKDRRAALRFLNAALFLSEDIGDSRLEAAMLAEIGRVLIGAGQPDAAILFLKRSVNVYQSLRADVAGLDKGLQKSYKNLEADKYRLLAGLLVRQGRLLEAEQVIELLKDDERFTFLRRDASVKTIREKIELAVGEKEWSRRWNTIKDRALGVSTQIDEVDERIRKAPKGASLDHENVERARLLVDQSIVDNEMDAFYGVIEAEAQKKREVLAGNRNRELVEFKKDVCGALDTLSGDRRRNGHVAAVYTLALEDTIHFIVATPKGATPISVPVDLAKVNALTEKLRTSLSKFKGDPKTAGKELYDLAFKEVVGQLRSAGIHQVMWSLDGALRYIPLPALWDGEHYLVETESYTVYSPLELGKLTSSAVGPPLAAAFGATHGGKAGNTERGTDDDGADFAPLPNVRTEVENVVHNEAKHATGPIEGVPWIDEEFTPDRLFEEMSDPYLKVAHIASHFRLKGDIARSVLLTGDGSLVSLERILGGTARAGVPMTLQKAQQVKPWSHLNLVVLSACDTASVMERSELGRDAKTGAEAESFASVVLSLGASSVMASLWSVSDESTALLMRVFYRNWVGGKTKSEALRLAQVALLHGDMDLSGLGSGPVVVRGSAPRDMKFAHPFFWAPFLLYGNWQ